MPFRLAILASGNGTNAQAMIDACQKGLLPITIAVIVSNVPSANVLNRAKKAGIPACVVDHKAFANREAYDQALLAAINDYHVDAIALAGYMRLLSAHFLQAFPGKVLNLHPAILPSFPGLHGARDAINYGVKLTGATVHFVDEIMDNGPVIIQAAVPVIDTETEEELLTRIHALEHRIYPQALAWLATNRLSVQGRCVHLTPNKVNLAKPLPNAFVWPPLEDGF